MASETLSRLYDDWKQLNDIDKSALQPGELDLDLDLKSRLMNARQTAMTMNIQGLINKNGNRVNLGLDYTHAKGFGVKGGISMSGGVKGAASVGRGVTALAGNAVKGAGMASAAGGLAGAAGTLGGLASMAAAAAGPVAIALALAPVIEEIAGANERAMEKDLAEVRAGRDQASSEVQFLLSSVDKLKNGENLEEREKIAEDMLNKVRNSRALTMSTPQGMALQQQLHALETVYSPTTMSAIRPYNTDAELVAGKSNSIDALI